LAQQKPSAQKTEEFRERVTVERVVITGRVIDRFANPIPGLVATDFRLRVDGRETPIEAIEWIPAQAPQEPNLLLWKNSEHGRRIAPSRPGLPAAPSRTIVMLFQWEIAGQKDTGFVRMMRQAERFVSSADPEDRFAVLGYGSSLRLLQDFTTDHAALRGAIESIRSLSFRGPTVSGGPELASTVEACKSTGSIQKAITCIGNSLQALPGPKTMLFFGWTIGMRRGPDYVEYPEMIEAVVKAQTSVFVLDVSGGRHTLAEGIARLASETGGLYNGGCVYEMIYCADLATLKTHRAVEGGTYELVFRDPAVERGWHQVDVELVGRSGTPLFHRWYRD
jgi:VWFA-related protein